ncbi:MAG TPA: hypothetical protein VFT22_28070 [Kofleriaceae bacterium]|nr:hypothetical protein [Kofleriaceae bacterium]
MKTFAVIAAALLAATGACGSAPPAPAPPAPAPADASALVAHRLGLHSLPAMQLLATPRGRDLLAGAISCALPAGASITAITSDGTPYSFAGNAGLAPAWERRAPGAGERRRLIACVRAHQPAAFRA